MQCQHQWELIMQEGMGVYQEKLTWPNIEEDQAILVPGRIEECVDCQVWRIVPNDESFNRVELEKDIDLKRAVFI